ncbi:MAG: energy transducer TonB, partial [Bacteroidales bacterium]|nr:energy transducer TonB [Bacteroidales bacterium]
MELKKSKKADLESKRTLFFQVGLVIVLAMLLLAFDWKSQPEQVVEMYNTEAVGEEEMVPITRQQPQQPPPPPPP